MPHILVVDDDPRIRELLRHFLALSAFEVSQASCGADALELLDHRRCDLVVLDIMMPGLDGWEVCRRIKRDWDIPVLMLTAKAETVHKLRGFELGTDDYLVKPFEPSELVARVKALLKRYRIEMAQTLQIGELSLDRQAFQVSNRSGRLTIPRKEFELLFKLASGVGRTFSRDQLIASVWGVEFDGNEHTLDVHINRLRRRFPQDGFQISVIRGVGYRLEVPDAEIGK